MYSRFILMGILLNLASLDATTSSFASSIELNVVDQAEQKEIHAIIHEVVPKTPSQKISFERLCAGFSGTRIYKVEVDGKKYVLRIHASSLFSRAKLEYEAMHEADLKGIGPHIHYCSDNYLAMLMDYVKEKSLTLEEAKTDPNKAHLAQTIRTVHEMTLPLHANFDIFSNSERCYQVVSQYDFAPKYEIDKAIELLREYQKDLGRYTYTKVRVHGDLNPRNIFLTSEGPILIDWAESAAEDPFYDLNYFSLFVSYNEKEENDFLKMYLQRDPSQLEIERYQLQKKITLTFWSLTNLYLANAELKKHPEQILDTKSSLKEWEFYRKIYADCQEPLDAQFFYEFSRLCLKRALES